MEISNTPTWCCTHYTDLMFEECYFAGQVGLLHKLFFSYRTLFYTTHCISILYITETSRKKKLNVVTTDF